MFLMAVQLAFAMVTLSLPLEALSCDINATCNATWPTASNDVQIKILDIKKITTISTNHPLFRARAARPESCPSLDFFSAVATEKYPSYGSVVMVGAKEDRSKSNGLINVGKNPPPFNPPPFNWVFTATFLVVVVAAAVVAAVCYPQFFGGGKMRFAFFLNSIFFLPSAKKGRIVISTIVGRKSATTPSSSTKGDRVTSTTAFLLTLLLSQQIQLVLGHFEQLCIGTRDPTKGLNDLCTDDMIYVYMVCLPSLLCHRSIHITCLLWYSSLSVVVRRFLFTFGLPRH